MAVRLMFERLQPQGYRFRLYHPGLPPEEVKPKINAPLQYNMLTRTARDVLSPVPSLAEGGDYYEYI